MSHRFGGSGWGVRESGCRQEEGAGKLAHLLKLIILGRVCSQGRLVFLPKASKNSTGWNAAPLSAVTTGFW